jgi:hypothetical protein
MHTHRFVRSLPICHIAQLIVATLQLANLQSLFRLRLLLNRFALPGASSSMGKELTAHFN